MGTKGRNNHQFLSNCYSEVGFDLGFLKRRVPIELKFKCHRHDKVMVIKATILDTYACQNLRNSRAKQTPDISKTFAPFAIHIFLKR